MSKARCQCVMSMVSTNAYHRLSCSSLRISFMHNFHQSSFMISTFLSTTADQSSGSDSVRDLQCSIPRQCLFLVSSFFLSFLSTGCTYVEHAGSGDPVVSESMQTRVSRSAEPVVPVVRRRGPMGRAGSEPVMPKVTSGTSTIPFWLGSLMLREAGGVERAMGAGSELRCRGLRFWSFASDGAFWC